MKEPGFVRKAQIVSVFWCHKTTLMTAVLAVSLEGPIAVTHLLQCDLFSWVFISLVGQYSQVSVLEPEGKGDMRR